MYIKIVSNYCNVKIFRIQPQSKYIKNKPDEKLRYSYSELKSFEDPS